LLAVVGELGGENPVGVGFEVEQFLAGCQVDEMDDFVCAAEGNGLCVGGEADAVEARLCRH
jgi:hypothetical protein